MGSVKLTAQLLPSITSIDYFQFSPVAKTKSLSWSDLPADVLAALRQGAVIPAHPLALTPERKLDVRRQKALTRYYIDAGSGGLAVGVHSTQFAIREVGLYEPVLKLAAETARDWTDETLILVAGLSGKTAQAKKEAEVARGLGYHAAMLSLAPMKGASIDELIDHCAAVAEVMPLVGFYLQTAVGGIPLPMDFWRRFAGIENVVAIKMAPFNRYRTLDVVRGVAAARAEERVTLYTGNDDHIVLDLAVPFDVTRDAMRGSETVRLRIKGGLLGHWSVWTKSAVELHARIRSAVAAHRVDEALLALDAKVTDANSAFFDVANDFAGCIPGCHEVLRRQGLLEGIWCLDPAEKLSPGQKEEIDRVIAAYPEFADDAFVRANLDKWLE
jgi:dihydrodipicolinate synthase/N-acetylneuraminate lyase